MYDEDDLLPISALQHLVFCERQWGLIHLEGIWAENILTVEGKHLHERADTDETESRGNLRVARGLRLRSLRIGLTGKADVVEFCRLPKSGPESDFSGVQLEGVSGSWRPIPVEYKRGQPKKDRCDEVQLCAQALCLEEMLGITIHSGALFYGKPRRRYEVYFDNELRCETETLASRLHDLTRAGKTPHATYEKKCENCSLFSVCLPKSVGLGKRGGQYLADALIEIKENDHHETST